MKLLNRLFIEFLDGMQIGDEFTLLDFQDYVKIRNPRICPSSCELAYLVKNAPTIGHSTKSRHWTTYKVVA